MEYNYDFLNRTGIVFLLIFVLASLQSSESKMRRTHLGLSEQPKENPLINCKMIESMQCQSRPFCGVNKSGRLLDFKDVCDMVQVECDGSGFTFLYDGPCDTLSTNKSKSDTLAISDFRNEALVSDENEGSCERKPERCDSVNFCGIHSSGWAVTFKNICDMAKMQCDGSGFTYLNQVECKFISELQITGPGSVLLEQTLPKPNQKPDDKPEETCKRHPNRCNERLFCGITRTGRQKSFQSACDMIRHVCDSSGFVYLHYGPCVQRKPNELDTSDSSKIPTQEKREFDTFLNNLRQPCRHFRKRCRLNGYHFCGINRIGRMITFKSPCDMLELECDGSGFSFLHDGECEGIQKYLNSNSTYHKSKTFVGNNNMSSVHKMNLMSEDGMPNDIPPINTIVNENTNDSLIVNEIPSVNFTINPTLIPISIASFTSSYKYDPNLTPQIISLSTNTSDSDYSFITNETRAIIFNTTIEDPVPIKNLSSTSINDTRTAIPTSATITSEPNTTSSSLPPNDMVLTAPTSIIHVINSSIPTIVNSPMPLFNIIQSNMSLPSIFESLFSKGNMLRGVLLWW